jgi:ribosomal protein L11
LGIELEREGEELGSIDGDIMKNLMDLRRYLEKKIYELEDEAEKLKALFKIVDEVIVTKSFRRAETLPRIQPEIDTPRVNSWEEVPLKIASGTLLATMLVSEEEIRIIPTERLIFEINTPPFQSFLIKRVLEAMRESDRKASERGDMTPDKIMSYEVLKEGAVIKEIKITNYGSEKRLREITSTSRWTLEKMYEKIQQPK